MIAGDPIPSRKLGFSVSSTGRPELVAPEIVEAQQGVLDPARVPNGATVRIGAEAQVKTGDTVVLQFNGQPGAGTAELKETANKDGATRQPRRFRRGIRARLHTRTTGSRSATYVPM